MNYLIRCILTYLGIQMILIGSAAAQPTTDWVAEFEGDAQNYDVGNDVAIAGDGSVYVAGATVVPTGGGGFASRALLLKYSDEGALLWQRTHEPSFPTFSSSATHVEIAPDGNIVIALATNSSSDFGVVKYDSAGNELWSRVYAGDSTFVTGPADLEIDAAGFIYITGDIGRFTGDGDIRIAPLLKYAPNGTLEWLNEYTGPASDGADGEALVIADDGSIYMAGSVAVSGAGTEFSVTKFSPAGAALWTHHDGYTGSFCYDLARAIGIDNNGNVIATGYFGSNTANGPDIATVKLSPTGAEAWTKLYDGPFPAGGGYGEDGGRQIVIDSSGNAIIVAHTQIALGDFDIYVVSYDSSGALRWEDIIAGDGQHNDWSRAVAIDEFDNTYVVGQYVRPDFNYHAFIAQYDSSGQRQFLVLNEEYNYATGGDAIAIGPNGSFAVTGETFSSSNRNIVTLMYSGAARIGDLDNNNVVDVTDLFMLLSVWGTNGHGADLAAPLNVVDVADLFQLLANWG